MFHQKSSHQTCLQVEIVLMNERHSNELALVNALKTIGVRLGVEELRKHWGKGGVPF